MEKRVLLSHETLYKFEKAVFVSPHQIKLHPTPNCKTEIKNFKMEISPKGFHFSSQLDVYSNKIARIVFSEKVDHLDIKISCEAVIRQSNPLDFFVEMGYSQVLFAYSQDLLMQLEPFLVIDKVLKDALLTQFESTERNTISLVIELNKKVFELLTYQLRMESGVQEPLETLLKASGSCRDYAWLLVNIYRSYGIASRFVSGYLIDLHASIVGNDALVLHAWVEVYIPGAGWIGLDPTSGLIINQQYIPLCAAPHFKEAAPVEGKTEKVKVDLSYSSSVKRLPMI